MARKIAASELRKDMVIIKRNGRGDIRRLIKVNDVDRDCERGGTHVNQLTLVEDSMCFDALAAVEVR